MKPEIRTTERRVSKAGMLSLERRRAAAPRRTLGLAEKLLEAREAERRLLARDLHDGLGQSLVVLQMNLRLAREGVSAGDPAADLLDASLQLVGGLHGEVRRRSLDLYSSVLDDLGLAPALRAHTVQIAGATRKNVGFELSGEARFARWPIAVETSAFRIAQEALANALRHARASHIGVVLTMEEHQLSLRIHDDGVGFDTRTQRTPGRRKSLGLVSMAERARLAGGHLAITSEPGRGTAVCVRFQRRRSRCAFVPQ